MGVLMLKSNIREGNRKLEREPTHPGVYVQKFILIKYDLTQEKLAALIGVSRLSINEIIRGKRNITENMALRFSRLTGTTPDVWLNLQRNYNLWKVNQEEGEAISRIKPLNH